MKKYYLSQRINRIKKRVIHPSTCNTAEETMELPNNSKVPVQH